MRTGRQRKLRERCQMGGRDGRKRRKRDTYAEREDNGKGKKERRLEGNKLEVLTHREK